jgi:hypothetical protein
MLDREQSASRRFKTCWKLIAGMKILVDQVHASSDQCQYTHLPCRVLSAALRRRACVYPIDMIEILPLTSDTCVYHTLISKQLDTAVTTARFLVGQGCTRAAWVCMAPVSLIQYRVCASSTLVNRTVILALKTPATCQRHNDRRA